MPRIIVHAVLMAGWALVLAGCGMADSRSPVPEFMRNGAIIDRRRAEADDNCGSESYEPI